MTARKTKSKIPHFESLAEEADFWASQDSAELEDEFVDADLKFAKPLIHVYDLEIDAKLLSELTAVARSKDLKVGELIRLWLREKLESEQGTQTHAKKSPA